MSLLTREDLVGSLFFPRADTSVPPEDARDLMVDVDGASIHVRLHGLPTAPMLLFFHGNGETVADWDDFAPRFTPSVQFAVCDYRGYGQSTGTPTMQRLFDDAVAVFDAVHALSPLAPLLMGRSLGSAAAWHLAQTRLSAISGLIIDSGFSDVDAFARRRGVPRRHSPRRSGPPSTRFRRPDTSRCRRCCCTAVTTRSVPSATPSGSVRPARAPRWSSSQAAATTT